MPFHKCFLTIVLAATGLPLCGQTTFAATAPTVVPALVLYADLAESSDGKPLTGETTAAFLLFKDEAGGEPLWTESQRIVMDAGGHYRVQLGASSPSGLPLEVFATGEARWLEVQIAGQKQQPRVLLSSVPYAAKAADAATLGGLPPSAFMLAGAKASSETLVAPAASSPDGTSNVTTTGGESDYVPRFNGTNTVISSEIYDNGTNVGIGVVPNSSVKFDIGGSMIVRGNTIVTRQGNATSSKGYPSFGFDFYSNVYNSLTKTTANPYFSLESEPTGNNTSSPSATFNLLFSGTGTPGETGLYFNPNGVVHFASGQTFPGTGDVSSIALTAPSSDYTVTGSPITKSGTLGFNWKVAPTSADTANAIVKRDANGSFTGGVITANQGLAGGSSVVSSYGVAGYNTGGGVAVYGEGQVGVQGVSNGSADGVDGLTASTTGAGVAGVNQSSGVGVSGSGGTGVHGSGQVGVSGQSTGTNGSADGVDGVTSSAGGSGVAGINNNGGIGVYGTGGTGVFGTGTVGFATDSNVQQARAAGGWVKAMVYVNGSQSPYSIQECFNSTLTGAAATTPPCGIDLEEVEIGSFTLNFNFQVNDRFFSATAAQSGGLDFVEVQPLTSTKVSTITIDAATTNSSPGSYRLMVY